MNNEGLMIFIIQAILALFAFFVVAPCVLNAVSLFTVQKRFARTMIDLGVVKEDVVKKLHPKKEIAGVFISLLVVASLWLRRVEAGPHQLSVRRPAADRGLFEVPPGRPVQQSDGEAVPEYLPRPDGREKVQRLRQQDLLMALTNKGGAAAPPFEFVKKRRCPFFDKRDFAPTRAKYFSRRTRPTEVPLGGAAAKNGSNLIRGLRAANSARLF